MSRHIGGVAPKNRLSRAVFDGNKLYLALGTTDYMEFTGTNIQAITNPDFRERLMQAGFEDAADSNHYFSSPLAVCAAIYGFNGKPGDVDTIYVPIGFRSKKVMIYPETYHVFGGVGVGTDIGQRLATELREEMGLKDEEMGAPTFHGIIRQGPSRVPEAICHIPVYVDQKELEERWNKSAPGKFEHRDISFYNLEQLPDFLKKNGPTMVPSGAAALTKLLEHY